MRNMRAMQYKGCMVIQQESVWYVLQSNSGRVLAALIPQLRSCLRALPLGFVLAATVVFSGLANADAPVLELPIDCQIGSTCWLVNHVDTNPGPGRQDYRCGAMSYNTHRGTDIAIANKRIMDAGVAILTSAPGTVIGTRDGMPETTAEELKSRRNIAGRECGNGVTIRHKGKWTTQYCHMKAGTVRVRRGDTVQTGDKLGEVGLSGMTEFPHIHLAVRNGDTVIDPFTGLAQSNQCNPSADMQGLWSTSVNQALAYPGPQPFHAGFDTGKPNVTKVRDGELTTREFSKDAPALVFWSESYTLNKNDVIDMRLIAPNGQVVSESRTKLDRPMARRFGFVGRKKPKGGWPVGIYTGRVEILHNNRTITQEATAIIK